jgi:enoyl-CoA hydratase/carnithine racemase
MNVRIEKQSRVFTIILNRPEARNAVDGPTAALLAEAFREFEADDEFDHGMASLNTPDFLEGVKKYLDGKGRKGSFTD